MPADSLVASNPRKSGSHLRHTPTRIPGRRGCGRACAALRRLLYFPPVAPEPGELAPDFTLRDQDGNPVTLSSLRGKNVVLYFYPKASTPGCTTQACGIRDHHPDYESANAVVLGVSPDPQKALAKFVSDQSLDFTLLGDEDHSVAEAYGVWVEKSMYGRKYMGMERSTFVIGPDGVVTHVFRKVKPAEHDGLVLAALSG
jgi:peroxiredoxin Q/BCP